jgi:hypothetical protein
VDSLVSDTSYTHAVLVSSSSGPAWPASSPWLGHGLCPSSFNIRVDGGYDSALRIYNSTIPIASPIQSPCRCCPFYEFSLYLIKKTRGRPVGPLKAWRPSSPPASTGKNQLGHLLPVRPETGTESCGGGKTAWPACTAASACFLSIKRPRYLVSGLLHKYECVFSLSGTG